MAQGGPGGDWMPAPTLQNCPGEPAPNCLRKVQIIQIIAAALQCVASPLCRVQVGV